MICVLCKHGVDPNSREESRNYGYFSDCTLLHYAAQHWHFEAVVALLDCGAEPRIVESARKMNALETAEAAYDLAKECFGNREPDDEVTKAHRVVEAIKKKMKL